MKFLEHLSKTHRQVWVMISGSVFMLHFHATVEKFEIGGWYTLSAKALAVNVAPALSEKILFDPDGGLFMESKGMGVAIGLKEESPEELLARYDIAAGLVH